MKVERVRAGVFSVTATTHELSTLLAGARMALSVIENHPESATDEARSALVSVLESFDSEFQKQRPERADD